MKHAHHDKGRTMNDELHQVRAELLHLKMQRQSDMATAWGAGWFARHFSAPREDNPYRDGDGT